MAAPGARRRGRAGPSALSAHLAARRPGGGGGGGEKGGGRRGARGSAEEQARCGPEGGHGGASPGPERPS